MEYGLRWNYLPKKFDVKLIVEGDEWVIRDVPADDYESAVRAVLTVLGLEEADVEVKMVYDGEKRVNGVTIKLHYVVKWPSEVLKFYREIRAWNPDVEN